MDHRRRGDRQLQPSTVATERFPEVYDKKLSGGRGPLGLSPNTRVGPMKFVMETRIAASPSALFAFHEAPGALERLTPPGERIEVIEDPKSLRVGSRVTLKMWMGPVPVIWIAEHTEYAPPHLFADRQVKGPFAKWYHRHRFVDDGAGGTLLRDEIEFEPPLGILGATLAGNALRAKLEKTFAYRHAKTKEMVESGSSGLDGGGEGFTGTE